MENSYRRIIREVGEFGRFQKTAAICLAVLALPHAMHCLSMAFLGALPEHHCRLPAINTSTSALDDFPLLSSPYRQDSLNGSIPLEMDSGGEWRYSRCLQYNFTDGLRVDTDNRTLQVQHCTDGWVYDRSHYGTSIVTQFDLVCDRAWLREFAQSVHMLGFSFGAITSGALSDRYGRRPTLLWCIFLLFTFSVASAFSPNYIVFVILKFVLGAVNVSIYYTAFVLGMELLDHSKHTMFGMCMYLFLVLGNMGIGTVSMIGRAGGILAPFVALLGKYWAPLPLLTFGVLSFLNGVAILALPETLGVPLPNTLEDAENLKSLGEKNLQNTEKILSEELQKTEKIEIYDKITVL
uniref:Major facilitator superfamily (MFS) profile domain-containing protein n=1 Tax=Branchiostoma floridae TaxID=7739 RepID=C3Y5E8_BRAFL|eukprot:XP_002608185.1 hypothetical protein BRAFLDRAFT_125863 [Branchiostoma floridae]